MLTFRIPLFLASCLDFLTCTSDVRFPSSYSSFIFLVGTFDLFVGDCSFDATAAMTVRSPTEEEEKEAMKKDRYIRLKTIYLQNNNFPNRENKIVFFVFHGIVYRKFLRQTS